MPDKENPVGPGAVDVIECLIFDTLIDAQSGQHFHSRIEMIIAQINIYMGYFAVTIGYSLTDFCAPMIRHI